MPTILRWRARRSTSTAVTGEPPHIHVDHSGRTMKIWLDTLKVAYNDGCPIREVTAILGVVDRNRGRFLEAWREYFDH
jgi:hypothetical protein